MEDYRLDILGISEERWLDFGEMTLQNGFTFLFSGATGENTEYRNAVGLLITKHGKKGLMEWKLVSERILTPHFKTHIRNVTLIQCYAPTEATEKS